MNATIHDYILLAILTLGLLLFLFRKQVLPLLNKAIEKMTNLSTILIWKDFAHTVRRLKCVWGESDFLECFLLNSAITPVVILIELSYIYIVGKMAYAFDFGPKSYIYYFIALLAALHTIVGFLRGFKWNRDYKRVFMPLERHVRILTLQKTASLSPGQVVGETNAIRDVCEQGELAIMQSVCILSGRLLPGLCGPGMVVIFLAFIDVESSIIAAVLSLVYLIVSIGINRKFIKNIESFTECENKTKGSFWEKMRNILQVILNSQKHAESAKYAREHSEMTEKGCTLWKTYQYSNEAIREPVCTICLITLLILTSGHVIAGEMTIGNFVTVMVWSFWMFGLLASITPLQRELLENWGRMKKYLDFLETLPMCVPALEQKMPGVFEYLEVRKGYYKYPETAFQGKFALDNVGVRIEKGSFTAFVGPSGSGKSTALSVIVGYIFLTKGEVLVNGVNIKELDLEWWWKNIGYIPQGQKLVLWNMSLVDNILYGSKNTTREQLVSVMKAARLYDDFFENGRMHEPIGENGGNLSGGERQRLAIARELLKEPDILMFDEAVTGLDTETEFELNRTILDLSKITDNLGNRKYTILLVTHNLTMAESADSVVVFNQGKVVASGPDLEVMEKCPLYRRLKLREFSNPTLVDVIEGTEEKSA